MTDLDPNSYATPQAYAIACAEAAFNDPDRDTWAICGGDPDYTEREYAIEADHSGAACEIYDELAGPIESMSHYVNPRLVTRQIIYGPWRYVTPEEIENA